MAISVIIFDCDGVLVESEALAMEVETQILAGAGLHYEPHEFSTRFAGLSEQCFFDAIEQDGWDRLGRSIVSDIRPLMQQRLQDALEKRLTEVPGAFAAVSSVKQRKAVASSSTSSMLETKLRLANLWTLFAPHIYSADAVTSAKPAPDLFLHVAKLLGVKPSACLVVEDSVNGVRAGISAGMRVWGFGGGRHMDEQTCRQLGLAGAEHIFLDWLSLQNALVAGCD